MPDLGWDTTDFDIKTDMVLESVMDIGVVAVHAALEPAYEMSQERVHKRTYTLMSSGINQKPEVVGSVIQGQISYGDERTITPNGIGYEIFHHEGHEIYDFSGKRTGRMHPPNKYLEGPIDETSGDMEATMAEYYSAYFGLD